MTQDNDDGATPSRREPPEVPLEPLGRVPIEPLGPIPSTAGVPLETDEEFADELLGAHNPRHRVTFGPLAFFTGFLSAIATFSLAVILISVLGGTFSWRQVLPTFGMAIVVLLYAGAIGLVVGAPIAFLLGLALRPVRNQGLHVLAFFVVISSVAWLIFSAMYGGAAWETVWLSCLIGACAAVGRASVWKLVDVYD